MGCPTVSILMNCLNGARYLREALDSVTAQTFTDWEVIFWDSNSTDASVAIAKSYGPKIRIFRGPIVSLGMARNWALANARGTYLAILDCDDVWPPTHLATLLGMRPLDPAVHRRLLMRANPLQSSALLFSAAAIVAYGGWNPTLRYAEMYELCLRLPAAYIWHCPQTVLIRDHPNRACGRGHAAVTREVLDVMRQHRAGAPWRQRLREGLLWIKYGWQRCADR